MPVGRRERFGAGIMEFYASTSQRVILANASGEKPSALGRIRSGKATPGLLARLEDPDPTVRRAAAVSGWQ